MAKVSNYVVFHGAYSRLVERYRNPPFIKGVKYMVKREMPDSYAVGKTVVFKADKDIEYFLGIVDDT